MTDLLLDECYSCIIASLALIKSIASDKSDVVIGVIEAAADMNQTCISCIRSHEAGSVLPETVERMFDESQKLIDLLERSSLQSPEATHCSAACENFIRTYHQVA